MYLQTEEYKSESRRSSILQTEEKTIQDGKTNRKSSITQITQDEETKTESRRSSLVEDKKKKVHFTSISSCNVHIYYIFTLCFIFSADFRK